MLCYQNQFKASVPLYRTTITYILSKVLFVGVYFLQKTLNIFKALHSKLLTELSSWFSSRNKFFSIFEVLVEHNFFVIFGKFGKFKKEKFPKFLNFLLTFLDFLQTFSKLFDPKTGFLLHFNFFCSFLKFSKLTYNFG